MNIKELEARVWFLMGQLEEAKRVYAFEQKNTSNEESPQKEKPQEK